MLPPQSPQPPPSEGNRVFGAEIISTTDGQELEGESLLVLLVGAFFPEC